MFSIFLFLFVAVCVCALGCGKINIYFCHPLLLHANLSFSGHFNSLDAAAVNYCYITYEYMHTHIYNTYIYEYMNVFPFSINSSLQFRLAQIFCSTAFLTPYHNHKCLVTHAHTLEHIQTLTWSYKPKGTHFVAP